MATSIGKKISIKFEIKNQGDLGGIFIIQVTGMEYAVNNYIEGISNSSLYLSAYITPSLSDKKVIKRIEESKINLALSIKNKIKEKLKKMISYIDNIKNDNEIIDLYDSNRICSDINGNFKPKVKGKSDYLSISIRPEISNMISANGILLSVENTLPPVLTARIFSSSAARKLKASSKLPHYYICYGSSGFNSMSTSANPSTNLDIGIRVYRKGISRGSDKHGAGGREYVKATGGSRSRNWKLRVYQAGSKAGSYRYDAKWSRKY